MSTASSFYKRGNVPRRIRKHEETVTAVARVEEIPAPVGSPYGFAEEDWKRVAEAKGTTGKLFTVFGFGVESCNYDTAKLMKNVTTMFRKAIREYNGKPNAVRVELVFTILTAGYGGHLFNEIARDIISADIAVFDISDQNANVMIEVGVALTWGVSVLLIKRIGCPRPPSDISGHTWLDYQESAREFPDPGHKVKLVRTIERAVCEKLARYKYNRPHDVARWRIQ